MGGADSPKRAGWRSLGHYEPIVVGTRRDENHVPYVFYRTALYFMKLTETVRSKYYYKKKQTNESGVQQLFCATVRYKAEYAKIFDPDPRR